MDICDASDDRIDLAIEDARRRAAKALAAIPVGNPGECHKCGEEMPRLVDGWCCRCRDRYTLLRR